MRHLGVIVVDGVKRGLVFQTEDEYDGINPGGELQQKVREKDKNASRQNASEF